MILRIELRPDRCTIARQLGQPILEVTSLNDPAVYRTYLREIHYREPDISKVDLEDR